jgi:adenosylcobyric acid synthase
MSNNSGVTPEGLEMGRAQIVQAEAAKIPPHVDMNPILLKPTSDVGSQVVVFGKVEANYTAVEYHRLKDTLRDRAHQALDRLRRENDVVVIEGAGSCAEVNLMDNDIVNFPVAEYAQAPVLLVADIHRGGVFAQIVGTLACLPADYRTRVAGFIINRFRGDPHLFEEGRRWIEARTGKPVFGILPWFNHFRIEAEDSVVIENPGRSRTASSGQPAIAVIRLPHIANFTDFDPLQAIEGLVVDFIEENQPLDAYRAVILPGSKNTRYDLQWLHDSGWTDVLLRFADQGGNVLGICGGYQMLGTVVHDPDGLEGTPGSTSGLGLLAIDTILAAPKTTTLTQFEWQGAAGSGYEIHMGYSRRQKGEAWLAIKARNARSCRDHDGAIGRQGRVLGTYIHGLFDRPAITRQWLESIGLGQLPVARLHGPAARDRDYDLLAAHIEQHIDMAALCRAAGFKC